MRPTILKIVHVQSKMSFPKVTFIYVRRSESLS